MIISKQTFSINPNEKQKYKAIFGLDFLCKNWIDFINSEKMIEWEGIRVPLENQDENKCNALEKKNISDNTYIPMTVEQIVNHDNQIHSMTSKKGKPASY